MNHEETKYYILYNIKLNILNGYQSKKCFVWYNMYSNIRFKYIWYYKIVVNMAHTELIISYQSLWIMMSMHILHYMIFKLVCEIIINQRNVLFGTIYITILDFTYIWYSKIILNIANTQLIITYQPLWLMRNMNTFYYIVSNWASTIFINQRNSWFGTIYITILHFTYI